ncbi:MAG: hypothetical protein ACXAB4_07705 [Candidatus Hodarchaeales archaeon]|jgi:hypothetical protein
MEDYPRSLEPIFSRTLSKRKWIIPWAIIGIITAWIFFLKPVEGSYVRDLIYVYVFLLAIFIIYEEIDGDEFFSLWFSGIAFLIAIVWLYRHEAFWGFDSSQEIITFYRSIFETLDQGKNPYTSETIYHNAGGNRVYTTCDYPPGEIPLYYLVFLLLDDWNASIYLTLHIIINGIACVIFHFSTPKISFKAKAPYFPIFLLLGIKQTVASVFLLLALILFVISRKLISNEELTAKERVVLILLFGIGLMMKYFIIPIFLAYFIHQVVHERKFEFMIDLTLSLLIALLLTMPFGIFPVFESVYLSRSTPSEIEHFATYYPHITSAVFRFLDAEFFYPFFAVAIFFSLIISLRRPLLEEFLLAAIVFLLIIPTPETQYFTSILLILVVLKFVELSRNEKIRDASSSA